MNSERYVDDPRNDFVSRGVLDRSVIAILDPRLRTNVCGRDFLNSLPRMRITDDLTDVIEIFD